MTRKIPSHFEFLTDNWDKLAVLRSDRKFEFYTKGGIYHTQSLPLRCRHFAYNPATADLLLASEESQLMRLNLEYGQFLESIPASSEIANVVTFSHANQLIVCGYENGGVEFFDPRDKRSLAFIDLRSDVSSITFNSTGMNLGVGLASGNVSLFDIRSSRPLLTYSHRNQSPVHSVFFHSSRKFVSGDRKGCRIYDEETGKFFTSFETKAPMNCVLPYPDSGLLFAAAETERVQVMLTPELGPSPRAFSFLDNLILDVEVDEQDATPLYEDQKFITREELEGFGMAHLLKASVLKPYMHGFFIPRELYRLVTDKGEAGGYEEWIRGQREAKQAREVVAKRKVPRQSEEVDKKKHHKHERRDPYYKE
jgi:ribosome biogenesis protein ENP2